MCAIEKSKCGCKLSLINVRVSMRLNDLETVTFDENNQMDI